MINLDKYLLFDGAMGTMLQAKGMETGDLPELLNLTNGDMICEIHKEYVAAGADIITANTFGASRRKLHGKATPKDVIASAVGIAKKAGPKYVALDIGPTGALLEPMGDLSFEEAYELFKEQVVAGVAAGADLILIETMSDLLEAKAAVLAAKENSDLPVFATMTFGEDGRTFLGTSPKIAAITLCGLGVSAVGVNCSLGPEELISIVEEILEYATVPVMVQANAGLPKIKDGKTVFSITAKEYGNSLKKMLERGISILGGCCGTTPEYTAELARLVAGKSPLTRQIKNYTAITSAQNAVVLDGNTALIGERINPTGKKKLKAALVNKDFDFIIGEALSQQDAGADLLDVNAGLPEIDEAATLTALVKKLQAVTPLPLQIDSADQRAMEAAARIYSGKPIINSVNGKKESMEAVFPIVKKYGAAVVALTLDETGIPETAEGRFAIAERILREALAFGIPKGDILIDCLVLTASTNQAMVMETLKAIQLVKSRLGLKTVLGVSNVSFGLPNRELINSTFLAAAFGAGLDMPILNPLSQEYMRTVGAFKVLNNEDKSSAHFIERFSEVRKAPEAPGSQLHDLKKIIINGYKGEAAAATRALLESHDPLEIINEYFIPALDQVGAGFETGEIFLPQLMTSAETVKCGFDVLRENTGGALKKSGDTILLATVKGDIHDIGKNIVKMLLENYGYDIVDLGRDVEPQLVVDTVLAQNIKLVGLSALMTTTVRFMAKTIEALRSAGADCKIMVGGAVLNEEYAKMVGADYYAKDATESAKIAGRFFAG